MGQFPVLYDAFDKVLRPAGFRRKTDTWYRRNTELIQLVNLQKSSWGKQYFVNIAWWLNDLGSEQFPKEYRCHLRRRCNVFVAHDGRVLDRLLDFEDLAKTHEERSASVANLFADKVLPFLQQTNSLAGLRKEFTADSWPPDFLVVGPARELVGLPPVN